MTEKSDAEYVLGTHAEEVARLGLQHRVWRPVVTECWQRVGITHGWRVLDAGAGPGYATADLAQIVGPAGAVLAIERSARFLKVARARCQSLGLTNVEFREAVSDGAHAGDLQFDCGVVPLGGVLRFVTGKTDQDNRGRASPRGDRNLSRNSDY